MPHDERRPGNGAPLNVTAGEHTTGRRLDAALAELADAIRAEVRAEAEAAAGMPDRLLSIPEAAAALGVARTTVYQELAAGRLRSIRVGRRRLVPASAVAERTATG